MGYRFDEVDVDSMTDDELTPVLKRVNEAQSERAPRAVDLTVEELRTFNSFPGIIKRQFLVFVSDMFVGHCEGRYAADGTNPDTLRCQIQVWPEFRRQGAGTAMLDHITGIARNLERGKLLTVIFDTVPAGAAFAQAVGGIERRQTHENILRIADLDRDLLQEWVDAGPERAPGYTVRVTEGDWPDDLFKDIAYLFHVLERDMPMSEGQEPRIWDADVVRDLQDHFSKDVDAIWAMAFDDRTGKAVGMSELIRRRKDPTTWEVTTTMVDPDHRGKSIGKWLKGAVNLQALESWPGGVYQETGNAFTNEPMLAINHAMGFEHEFTITDVEIPVDNALAYLASRS
jgi:GNAT superfamily N-acetyltransferase